jgi:hypothetical protein
MAAIVRAVGNELENEWGYLLYLALTVWFSLRFFRDSRRDLESLSSMIGHLELSLETRLRNIEVSLRASRRTDHPTAAAFSELVGPAQTETGRAQRNV